MKIESSGLKEIVRDMVRASGPLPSSSLLRMETTAKAASAAVESVVHVQTGKLKLSGRTDTHYEADQWSVEIDYAARPGIFELWRGEDHFFFNAVEPFIPQIEQNVDEVMRDMFGGPSI